MLLLALIKRMAAPLLGGGISLAIVSIMESRRRGKRLDAVQHLGGMQKPVVRRALGPPVAATRDASDCDSWYYPFDTVQRVALVIRFYDGVARIFALIRSPRRACSRTGRRLGRRCRERRGPRWRSVPRKCAFPSGWAGISVRICPRRYMNWWRGCTASGITPIHSARYWS